MKKSSHTWLDKLHNCDVMIREDVRTIYLSYLKAHAESTDYNGRIHRRADRWDLRTYSSVLYSRQHRDQEVHPMSLFV